MTRRLSQPINYQPSQETMEAYGKEVCETCKTGKLYYPTRWCESCWQDHKTGTITLPGKWKDEPPPSAIEQCQVHSTPLNWCNQCGINEGIIQERSKGETPLAIIMDKLDDLFYAVDANAKALIELADMLESRTNQGTK